MATLITHRFELDVTPGGVEPVVHVSQRDSGCKFVAELVSNRVPFTPPSGTVAKVIGKIAGNSFSKSASLSNNKVEFSVLKTMTLSEGKLRMKVKLEKNGSQVATGAFVICVDPEPTDDTPPIEAGQAFIYNGNDGGEWITLESTTDYANGDEVGY